MNLCEVFDSSIIDAMKDKSICKHWACEYLIVVTNGFCLLKWNVTNCLSKLNLHVMFMANELV
jgi:hypothetical protein